MGRALSGEERRPALPKTCLRGADVAPHVPGSLRVLLPWSTCLALNFPFISSPRYQPGTLIEVKQKQTTRTKTKKARVQMNHQLGKGLSGCLAFREQKGQGVCEIQAEERFEKALS